jgi:hypothetical protein
MYAVHQDSGRARSMGSTDNSKGPHRQKEDTATFSVSTRLFLLGMSPIVYNFSSSCWATAKRQPFSKRIAHKRAASTDRI